MALIVLRSSRNTQSYYLVESHRDDQGETRRRTLCYLGRQQDGTDTLAKALAHWEQTLGRTQKELRKVRGQPRQVIRRRMEATRARIGIINEHIQRLARVTIASQIVPLTASCQFWGRIAQPAAMHV